jgi:hypothetical protein
VNKFLRIKIKTIVAAGIRKGVKKHGKYLKNLIGRSSAQPFSKLFFILRRITCGYNMQEEPSDTFTNFAQDMVDHGVDVIHGHSAHIFQGIEIYKEKLILYDTGDFVDDYAVDEVR